MRQNAQRLAYSARDAFEQMYTEPNALHYAKQYRRDAIILRDVRYIHGEHNKGLNMENIIGYDALFESLEKCAKGVRWKGTVAYYIHHWTDEIKKLSDQLHDGTYKERKAKFFVITDPKTREIMSIHFRDRIYQRSLNDVAVYPQVTKSFIADNFACQKGKGTNKARDRLKEFLHQYYRKNGIDGWVLKIDIKGYYPNMNHEFAETMFKEYLDDETYQLARKVLANLPGDIGYNPGSQIVQIVGITALDKVDHFVKERLRIKHYIRYMDDFVLIHKDREYLEYCLERIKEKLAENHMEVNEKKTFIQRISKPIKHLGFYFRLTETGKVVILADPKKIKHERKKIKRMVELVRKGKRSKKDVDAHFKAWKASVRYGNSYQLIYRLNRWYDALWRADNED